MKRFLHLLIICLSLGLGLFLTPPAFAGEIIVAAAANVQFTLEELKATFEKDHPGTILKTIIGSSGKLTAQIENGAPFDLFLSADMEYPEAIYKEGLASTPAKVYAYGTLVLWTLRDLDLNRGMDILKDPAVKKVALPSPKSAPYGRQAVNALQYLKLHDDVSPKLVYGESIAQSNQFIAEQAADIGFTAKSTVTAPNMKDKGKWVEVPAGSYDPIAQGVVILKYGAGKHPREVQTFYDFLFSGKAREIMKRYGYLLP